MNVSGEVSLPGRTSAYFLGAGALLVSSLVSLAPLPPQHPGFPHDMRFSLFVGSVAVIPLPSNIRDAALPGALGAGVV